MTTKTTRTHEKILDSKKFENLPFHKGQVSLKASQTAKLDDLDLEYEYDRAIEYANTWAQDDVNKAIKQIKNDPNITEYQRQKAFEELDAFLGNTNPNPRAAAALDKWREHEYYDYEEEEKKFLESLANKKGGKRRRKKKTRKTRKRKKRKTKKKRRRNKKTRKKRGGKTTVLGFPLPIFDLWQAKVKVNNTRKEVKQWKEFIEKKTKKGGRRKKRTRRR